MLKKMTKRLKKKSRQAERMKKIKMMTDLRKFAFQEARNLKRSLLQSKSNQTTLNKMKTTVTNSWQ
jgi:hypothetical protein